MSLGHEELYLLWVVQESLEQEKMGDNGEISVVWKHYRVVQHTALDLGKLGMYHS